MSDAPSRRLLFGTTSAAAAIASVPTAIAATHSDAELIRLCDAHPALMNLVNGGADGDDDHGPAWQAYDRSRDAIGEARPQTLAGVLALARAAKAEARRLNDEENPAGTPAEEWGWHLVNDLLAIGGEGGMSRFRLPGQPPPTGPPALM